MLVHGYPTIGDRARLDLTERAQYWLYCVLKHRLPPGGSLEIGSAHGGFVRLMQLAGFDAAGMEMSRLSSRSPNPGLACGS